MKPEPDGTTVESQQSQPTWKQVNQSCSGAAAHVTSGQHGETRTFAQGERGESPLSPLSPKGESELGALECAGAVLETGLRAPNCNFHLMCKDPGCTWSLAAS